MIKPKLSINKDVPKESYSLPFNGHTVKQSGFSFSFSCFDRSHDLFNLGGTEIGWYLDLLDCLKSTSGMSFNEIKTSLHDIHPIDWSKTNTHPPQNYEQIEYWQFRINKSKGRIIGFIIDGVFYVVWLDAHHNLTNSDGYGKEVYFQKPLSIYERQESTIMMLQERVSQLEHEVTEYEEFLK